MRPQTVNPRTRRNMAKVLIQQVSIASIRPADQAAVGALARKGGCIPAIARERFRNGCRATGASGRRTIARFCENVVQSVPPSR